MPKKTVKKEVIKKEAMLKKKLKKVIVKKPLAKSKKSTTPKKQDTSIRKGSKEILETWIVLSSTENKIFTTPQSQKEARAEAKDKTAVLGKKFVARRIKFTAVVIQ